MVTKTSNLLKSMKQQNAKVTPIGTEIILPNHSGISVHPEMKNNWVPYTGATSNINLNSKNILTTGTLGAGAATVTNLTDSAMTVGSVLFAGTAGLISQDNANLFWDNTNKRLGIGIANWFSPLSFGQTVGKRIALYETNTGTFFYGITMQGAGTSGDPYRTSMSANSFENIIVTNNGKVLLGGISAEGTNNITIKNSATISSVSAPVLTLEDTGDSTHYRMVTGSVAGIFGFSASRFSISTEVYTDRYGTGTGTERFSVLSNGNIGIGTTSPTARLHLPAGTATAGYAPLKFTSGTLLTTAEAGAKEFLTDDFYGTITTGAARKKFILDDGTNLVSGDVPYVTTNGRLKSQTPVANGTYVMGLKLTPVTGTDGTITITNGIITAITQAT